MALTINFDLQEQDLDYYRQMMQKTQDAVRDLDRTEVLTAARKLATEVRDEVPEFVASRLLQLEQLVNMVEDSDWDLTEEEKLDVLSALAYFAKAEDLIDDRLPVLGFLDDAIMIELVARELADDLKAYEEFCVYRHNEIERRGEQAHTTKADWLEAKRKELHAWMRRRRSEKRSGSGSAGFRSFFSFRG
ncbi:hypothetical protein GCM10009092_20010 [Bowmanella denitrificans]|uniref:DUF1232 domain-containing protein n=1 Tax=Bowmanella denitrificans TaxID=366582 RepID=A0ABP3GVD2_9ALTE